MWTQQDFKTEVCLQPPPNPEPVLTPKELARLLYRAIWFMEGGRFGMARKEMDTMLTALGAEPYDDRYGGQI